ncbi:Phenylacetaldoxime dehydratase [Colletotrichum spinosum]|uniref:Phenylacetaldoxime dehydratase n=1 Tax=Colletotrichum spinosum TaxID=1347390 RepID=A0A4V3HQS0_9PEZI|nr:Phenylacetaldoxime dehydratase [Colletotrichum spinosum]
MSLESAIPEWLQTERTVPARQPPGFKPSFELYTSRFPKTTKHLVMAVIGAQYATAAKNDGEAIRTISTFISSDVVNPTSRPGFHEVAAVTDNRGFFNTAVVAYWTSKQSYEDWATTSGFCIWWNGLEPDQDVRNGWFLEIFFPTIERLETVFSTAVPEGVAHLRESITGPIQEHVYWGSMRDRFPSSQTDELLGATPTHDHGRLRAESAPRTRRVRVPGRKNLAVIRSGQDWSAAVPEERQLYLDSIQPPLIKGMDYLRDRGSEVGCLSCRFMEMVDPVTAEGGTDRTFCLAYFDNLASLEGWSREHETHLAIFADLTAQTITVEKMKFLGSAASAAITLASISTALASPVAEDFTWSDPFGPDGTPSGFAATCEASATFRATQHILNEIHEPLPVGLEPWFDAIKSFFGGRPFPGGWGGEDAHGVNREVIKMEYVDLPSAVKTWIQEQKGKDGDSQWLFGVYEKPKSGGKVSGTARAGPTSGPGGNSAGPAEDDLVVLFAPGAIYEILPLWVAEKSDCGDEMLDLTRYGAAPTDDGVVAWVVERTTPDGQTQSRDVTFKVKAQVLEETREGRVAREAREEEADAGEALKSASSSGYVQKDEL